MDGELPSYEFDFGPTMLILSAVTTAGLLLGGTILAWLLAWFLSRRLFRAPSKDDGIPFEGSPPLKKETGRGTDG